MWNTRIILPFLLLPASESVKSGFSVGRISEGQFEFSELNGWMTPRRARLLCENNSQCGGFTYKVKQVIHFIKWGLLYTKCDQMWKIIQNQTKRGDHDLWNVLKCKLLSLSGIHLTRQRGRDLFLPYFNKYRNGYLVLEMGLLYS